MKTNFNLFPQHGTDRHSSHTARWIGDLTTDPLILQDAERAVLVAETTSRVIRYYARHSGDQVAFVAVYWSKKLYAYLFFRDTLEQCRAAVRHFLSETRAELERQLRFAAQYLKQLEDHEVI